MVSTLIFTMSNEPSAAAGCAVGHDGQLLDETQIQWFHDVDNDVPLPPTLISNLSTSGTIKIHIPPPAAWVAGQRHVERILPVALHRPTNRGNTIHARKRRASSAGLSSQDESVAQDHFCGNEENHNDTDDLPMDTDTNLSDGLGITNMTNDDHGILATELADIDRAVSLNYHLSLI